MRFFWITASIVFLLDRVTKYFILKIFPPGREIVIHLCSYFNIVKVWNKGVAFGLFSRNEDFTRWIFIVITILMLIISYLWAKKTKKAKHTFNYNLMKNGNWNGDFLKKPNKQMRSVWAINTPKNGEKKYGKHPTQKPEALLERIILASSNEGDIVLDPFCGSVTTGVVAIRYKRKFVGIDSEKQYLDELAIPRIRDELLLQR